MIPVNWSAQDGIAGEGQHKRDDYCSNGEKERFRGIWEGKACIPKSTIWSEEETTILMNIRNDSPHLSREGLAEVYNRTIAGRYSERSASTLYHRSRYIVPKASKDNGEPSRKRRSVLVDTSLSSHPNIFEGSAIRQHNQAVFGVRRSLAAPLNKRENLSELDSNELPPAKRAIIDKNFHIICSNEMPVFRDAIKEPTYDQAVFSGETFDSLYPCYYVPEEEEEVMDIFREPAIHSTCSNRAPSSSDATTSRAASSTTDFNIRDFVAVGIDNYSPLFEDLDEKSDRSLI